MTREVQQKGKDFRQVEKEKKRLETETRKGIFGEFFFNYLRQI
jgi:hypothetical protein